MSFLWEKNPIFVLFFRVAMSYFFDLSYYLTPCECELVGNVFLEASHSLEIFYKPRVGLKKKEPAHAKFLKQFHIVLAVLIRSLSVNLTLQVWKSGRLDFGRSNCRVFGNLDCWTI